MKLRRHVIFLLLLLCASTAFAEKSAISPLVAELDTVLESAPKFENQKQTRIDQLLNKHAHAMNDEERLWLNKMLYDEYSVYMADSAMEYADRNIDIARRLGRPSLEQAWEINKVFLLAAQGLLSEAENEMEKLGEQTITPENRYPYFETAIYLYTHLSQYIGRNNGMSEQYDSIANRLRHEALRCIDSSHPAYYGLKAALLSDPSDPEWKQVKARLSEVVDNSRLNDRTSAINAYGLAKMCLAEGDEKGHVDNLIKSAMADIRMSNRDIASLEELATIFYENNDIDRGYAYINHCLRAALLYPNRVRVVNISSVLDKLQQATEKRYIEQREKLSSLLILVTVLLVILAVVVVLIIMQFRKLKNSHEKLMESKGMLNDRMKELSETQESLAAVNRRLTDTVEKLRQSNEQLIQQNFVKEEYVGYVFSIFSGYLTKMEEFRKNIARKLKVGQINDVKALITSEQIGQNELREFYKRFDTIFLHIYPRFVDDFNALLRPEERIALKKGELLNTELRIYALVRLGINNSVEIAEFLHMSSQTVYNCRLRVRNKAAVTKEDFATLVASLGKDPSTLA